MKSNAEERTSRIKTAGPSVEISTQKVKKSPVDVSDSSPVVTTIEVVKQSLIDAINNFGYEVEDLGCGELHVIDHKGNSTGLEIRNDCVSYKLKTVDPSGNSYTVGDLRFDYEHLKFKRGVNSNHLCIYAYISEFELPKTFINLYKF